MQVRQRRPFEVCRQLLELRGGLPGKADDEAGANGHAWDGPADALQQLQENFAGPI